MTIKKLLLSAATLLTTIASHADEGMWMLYNLPDAVYKQMQAEGFQLSKSKLYDDADALSNSVVNFGGFCTGEVVSPNGLVFTNHHCGFEAIRSHSTVEHDYMLNGFVANDYKDELSNPDLFVAFMRKQEDVTERLRKLGSDSLSPFELGQLIDSLASAMTDEARATDSTYYVEIDAFYEGNAYYATTYQRYDDVRLVYAPPMSMGKFGGETDNWMWPRQTCDVSVFRVYVDPKTGGPAAYSKDNVPMKPKTWLKVSTEGYKDGDFAMIMGYPGSTERYLSSFGIREMRDCVNDPRQQVRGVKQQVMRRYMDADEAVRIKYDSKYAQSSNYWKNSIGMNKCIDSLQIIELKQQHEARIRQWLNDNPDAMLAAGINRGQTTATERGKLDLDLLASLYARRYDAMRAFTFFTETFSRRSNVELATRAMKYTSGMTVKGPEKKPRKQYVEFDDNSATWDAACDIDMFATMIRNYREQADKQYHPSFYEKVDRDFQGDYKAYVEHVWHNTVLMQAGKKIPVRTGKKLLKDPGIDLSLSLLETMSDIKMVLDQLSDSIKEQERLLCLAKVRVEQDQPHYSDANFTLRLTYGQVGGYMMGGKDSGYYTTAASIVSKMAKGDKIREYQAQPELIKLMAADDFGQFTDSVSGTLNLCFLSNNDITGGNSGSPIVDGQGRLIGLAFDGNWDSLSADIFFDKTLARTINVDVRYVLYLMKHWGKADRLLKEMGVE